MVSAAAFDSFDGKLGTQTGSGSENGRWQLPLLPLLPVQLPHPTPSPPPGFKIAYFRALMIFNQHFIDP